MMLIDIRPLIHNRQFRLLFLGQTISFLGGMLTYIAIPIQIYELTKSSFVVGLVGAVQLVPLVLAGLYGGAVADTMDRRRLLLVSESLLTLTCFLLVLNCLLPQPSVIFLFVIAALSSVLVGFHRPAMEAITPQLVKAEDLPAVAALGSLRYSIGAIGAPAIGGWMIAQFGLVSTYSVDTLTYLVSLACLWAMKPVAKPNNSERAGLNSIRGGIQFAMGKPVILGTYVVDILAMVFAMPMALYPAMAEQWGGPKAAGWLYSALPLGALLISIFSGAFSRIHRHGAGVIISATAWGLFIMALAFAPNLTWAVALLALAGAADSLSGIYRQTIWNETIPVDFRGRLAGLNMLSYMIGPLLGNARAGIVASYSSNSFSILSGGILCTVSCLVMIWVLPTFWHYRNR